MGNQIEKKYIFNKVMAILGLICIAPQTS